MKKCSVNDCDLDIYPEKNHCILHCEKGNYSTDHHNTGFLSEFYNELVEYIINQLFELEKEDALINNANLRGYLKDEEYLVEESDRNKVTSFVRDKIVVMDKIIFPTRDSRDYFDYLNVLKRLGPIHFNICEFRVLGLELSDIQCFYQQCQFHSSWHIYNVPILNNSNSVLYQDCVFHDDVSLHPEDQKKCIINSQLFNDCEFKKDVEFHGVDFNAPIFNNTDNTEQKVHSLRIIDCKLHEKFILNHSGIGYLSLENTVFNSKFEFKNNAVEEFRVFNTNFLKLVDAYETKYGIFDIKKSIFEDFVGFEKCTFGKKRGNNDDLVARFIYATFLSFINFRNTTFSGGLDIENINLKEPPNFYNANIDFVHTNRETYRIIKNSFDKIGNHIEANKYFALEMKKYKEELKNTNKIQERIILFFNEKISNFGQSYVQPVFYMIVMSIFYYLLILGYENNVLYEIHPVVSKVFSMASECLNNVSKNILPFQKILKDGMEFVSLVFHIVFAVLVWQTIVAVKRHTIR